MKFRNLVLSVVFAASMLFAGAASAQVGIEIGGRRGVGIGMGVELGAPPMCDYGYYDFEPYECAPLGYYGDGYFYNRIFLGVGPWGGWGYNHGWGEHRFRHEGRGGSYRGNAGRNAHQNGIRGDQGNRGNNRGGNRSRDGGRPGERRR